MHSIRRTLSNLLRRAFSKEMEDDYLYYSHEKLLGLIQGKGDHEAGIREYLSTVKYAPIKDFKSGLEWFNVSEPLSFEKHLKGKVVVLDFFTYCCINCMHILPDLKEIEAEFSVEDGLAVVGVHSAKFENEKLSSNILAAVQRYNICHPVVNDHGSDMWQKCDVQCWPTLLLLGPSANPIVMLTGEGHKEDLRSIIKVALDFYREKNQISNHKLPFKSAYHLLPDLKGPLLFPGKITNFVDQNGREILAVSDTGNNRILILNTEGSIYKVIGGKKLGFKDGDLENAEFNNPQGLVFQNKDVLFVADTENHAIRRIDLSRRVVETVAGTGHQGHDRNGGKPGKQQALSSPWDVVMYRTHDMDLSLSKSSEKEVLIIAMAGTHQIWALFLNDTVWWKCKKYSSGTCVNIAGSGREENRNNQYPHAAAFAQPSGLALSQKNKEVYIADSESSSIRRLSLIDGKVTAVVGGDRNPNNLFAFGDKDGSVYDAKLQHSLGVALSPDEKTLYVADTYNHKLKKVDVSENKVSTLHFKTTDTTDGTVLQFREPAGLCLSSDGSKIYLADTNNHQIKVVSLDNDSNMAGVQRLSLTLPEIISKGNKSSYNVVPASTLRISKNGGKLVIKLNFNFVNGMGLTPEAPQKWTVDLPDPTWSCIPKSGEDITNIDVVISVPNEVTPKNDNNVDISINFVACIGDACLPKNFTLRVPVAFDSKGQIKVEKEININLDQKEISCKM